MKKLTVLLVAVFLAAFAVSANAANITVANTDFKLAGGISASYNYLSDTRSTNTTKNITTGAVTAGRVVDDHDYFNADTAIVHLFKTPTLDSPVGGHLAFGSFDVKLVTGEEMSPTITDFGGNTENFRLWLGYFSYMPVENLTVDAGLLWSKFGDAPITIMNSHVTRPVAFRAQPVCFAGGRVGYDAGLAKVYVGTNNGSALGAGHGNLDGAARGETLDSDRAYEVGACANIEALNIGVHYFDHDEGYNTINGSVGVEAGMFNAKVEVNYVTTDTYNRTIQRRIPLHANGDKAKDDDAISWALYACAKLTDNFKIPIRVELVDDMMSGIYNYHDGWNVAVTPTFNPTPNSFIRLEGVYVEDNNDGINDKVFRDSKGRNLPVGNYLLNGSVVGKSDHRHAVIAEFGFLF